MHADIDERAEGSDVGHDAGQLHAECQVGGLFDAVGELEDFKLLARIAAGLGELFHDVA